MSNACVKIKTIDSINAMADEIRRLGEENKYLKKQLFEQYELTGKSIIELSKKNLDYLKYINHAYSLMKKSIAQFKLGTDDIRLHQNCVEMQMLCNDIEFRYHYSNLTDQEINNLIDQNINNECLDCDSFGTKAGECKGMVGGAPCCSFQEKRIPIDPFVHGRCNSLVSHLLSLFK